MKSELNEKEKFADLLQYFQNTWIEHPTWKPENWSIFGLTIRTNNSVEGWHNRIKSPSKGSFYGLVDELKREADLVEKIGYGINGFKFYT